MIKAVFFDAGFTLIDVYEKRKSDLFEYFCRMAGVEIEDSLKWKEGANCAEIHFQEAHRDQNYYYSEQFWIDNYAIGLQGAGMSKKESFKLATYIDQQSRLAMKTYSLDPHCIDTLHNLKQLGLKLAIVSNWDGTLVELTKKLNINRFFDYIADSKLEGFKKPDPQLFTLTMNELNVKPSQVIHVGDLYYSDVIGAQRAGIEPILYDQLNVLDSIYQCKKIRELKEIIPIIKVKLLTEENVV